MDVPRIQRTGAAAVVLFLSTSLSAAASATGCDSMAAERTPILDVVLDVRAQQTVTRELLLPAATDLLLLAREDGEDVVVRLRSRTGRLREADSPIRRSGIQHIVFSVARSERLSVEVQGKEHDQARGRVQVRIVALRSQSSNACVAPLRSFAVADEAYALAQSVTRGIAKDSTIDAERVYTSSVQAYRAAADQLHAAGASSLLAEARHSAASAYYLGLGEWAPAASWAEEAAQTYAAVQDLYGRARSQATLAAALIELPAPAPAGSHQPAGERRDRDFARQLLESIASFHEARGERYEQAMALNNIGLAHYVEGSYEMALQWYRRAVPLFEQGGELTRHVQVLSNIALVETEVGKFAEAVEHYNRALALAPKRELTVFLNILNNSALANYARGDYDKALSQYGQALDLATTSQNAFYQGVSLHGIGIVYTMLGEQSVALQHFERALALRSPQRDARGRRATLREIGEILRQQGRAEQALAAHEEALTMAHAPDTTAAVRVLIARDLFALGRAPDALASLAPVLQSKVAGNDSSWSNALIERARYRAGSGDLEGAAADVDLALSGERVRETPALEFAGRLEQARIARQRGSRTQALAAVEGALLLSEEMRLQSANPTLRATALQRARPAFDLKIAMLAEQYAVARSGKAKIALQALECAEQARARALEDFRRLDAAGVPAQLNERRAQLYLTLAARRTALDWAVDRGTAGEKQARYLRAEIAGLRRSLDEIDALIGSTARDSQPLLRRGIADVRRTPADVAVLEYWIGADEALVWEITRDAIVLRRLGPSSRITRAANDFHEALRRFASTPISQRLARSAELYQLVIEPIDAAVLARRTLIIIPDGSLHYVPFAALRPATSSHVEYLVQRHDVATAPSLRQLFASSGQVQAAPSTRRMLLVVDPVFEPTDPRFQSAATVSKREGVEDLAATRGGRATTFERLPGTAREGDLIARLLAKDDLLRLDGFEATRERFLGAALESYRFIHVASHAIADSQTPQASALILSMLDRQRRRVDGHVLAADFVNVRLNADLVVLSACDTALGRDIAGEGLIGLRYVVLARGARAVVASLWPVPDVISAELMQSLYLGLLREKSTPWVALSAGMRQMIARGYSDPGIWATYELTLAQLAVQAPGRGNH